MQGIDTSQLQTYISCPRKYRYQYVEKIHKSELDSGIQSRNFGSDIHTALKIWQDTKDIEKGIEWFRTNYQNIEGENIRTVDNGCMLLREYVKWEKVNFPNIETLETEQLHTYKIDNIDYMVKIDRIVKFNNNIYVWDYKTTTSFGHTYFQKFDPNTAVSAYCNYCFDKYGTCSGFIPAVLQVGFSDKGQYLKDGDNRIWQNKETKTHYRTKEDMDFVSSFWCKFDYDIINRNKEQLIDFKGNVIEWYKRFEESLKSNNFPKNEDHCSAFYGCQYKELCRTLDDESVKRNMYVEFNPYEYLEGGE